MSRKVQADSEISLFRLLIPVCEHMVFSLLLSFKCGRVLDLGPMRRKPLDDKLGSTYGNNDELWQTHYPHPLSWHGSFFETGGKGHGGFNTIRGGADMTTVRYPSRYQINMRVWLMALSRTLDRRRIARAE